MLICVYKDLFLFLIELRTHATALVMLYYKLYELSKYKRFKQLSCLSFFRVQQISSGNFASKTVGSLLMMSFQTCFQNTLYPARKLKEC